jgi:hypothetical protein
MLEMKKILKGVTSDIAVDDISAYSRNLLISRPDTPFDKSLVP